MVGGFAAAKFLGTAVAAPGSTAGRTADTTRFPAIAAVASSSSTASGSATDEAAELMICRAAANRTKYKRAGAAMRLLVEQVGFHPCNRDGQPPNGFRCCELLRDILSMGFDAEEPDTNGIAASWIPNAGGCGWMSSRF
jgi:hypothetical protein